MDWSGIASELAELHDFSIYLGNYNYASLQKQLVQADFGISARKWVSFSIAAAGMFSAFASLITLILQINAYLAFEAMIFSFFGAALLLLKLPSYVKKKRAEEIEAEYSIALREIILGMRMGQPFERIIGNVARGNYGKLGREFRKAYLEIENGAEGVRGALEGIGKRVDSQMVSRINSQLIFVYENGTKGSGLSKLAEEMMLVQKMKMREYSSKMAFLGLLFIAISCIVPALFAAYVIIGSSFLSLTITEGDILAAYLIIFPAASLAALLFIKEKSPAILI
ncbi:MAG: type II secretion system F family protein [Candidatus Micrarchaeota archaeon]